MSSVPWSIGGRPGPVHIVLRSADPDLSDAAGFVIASAMEPKFVLLEMRDAGGTGREGSFPWRSVVHPDRHLVATAPPPAAVPSVEGAPPSWPIVFEANPGEVLSDLTTFLSQPEASERLFRPRLPPIRPLPVLIANGGVAARLFPDDPIVTGHLMAVQKQFQISVLLASDGTPRRDFMVFDYVFDVRPTSEAWPAFELRCARAPVGASVQPGDAIPSDEIAGGAGSIGALRRGVGATDSTAEKISIP